MKKPLKAINPWAAIDAIVKTEPEPTGPEWFTTEQFAVRYNLSIQHASARCRQLAATGKLKSWKGVTSATRRIACKYRAA